MARIPIALQLYTVREEMKKDVRGTIKEVAKIGYEGIEAGGTYGLSAKDFKQLLKDNGLSHVGGGAGLPALKNELQQQVDQCRELGINTLMIGSVQKELKDAGNDWKKIVAEIAEAAAKATKAGLRILYHNHDYEFKSRVDGMYALDYIYKTVSPGVLKAEIDTYWVKTGGGDPVDYIRRYAGRLPYLHIKDRKHNAPAGERWAFTEIGNGSLDWDAIFAAAQRAGVEWYIVEQDQTDTTPLDSARRSFAFMKSRGMA